MACAGCAAAPRDQLVPLVPELRQLHVRGQQALQHGDLARAKELFERARRLAERHDDRIGLVYALNDLGSVASAEEAHVHAVRLQRDALSIAEGLGHPAAVLFSLGHLGASLLQAGQAKEALAVYDRAVGLARDSADRRMEAVLLNNLGLAQQETGALGDAERSFRQALDLNRKLGERQAEAANLVNLGLLAERNGALVEAQQRFEEALALDKSLGQTRHIAADLAHLSRVTGQRGLGPVALDYARRAYRGYRALGDLERARGELQRVLTLVREQGDRQEIERVEAELRSLSANHAAP